MTSTFEKKCPKCGYPYMTVEHHNGDLSHDCYMCGFSAFVPESGRKKIYNPNPNTVSLYKTFFNSLLWQFLDSINKLIFAQTENYPITDAFQDKDMTTATTDSEIIDYLLDALKETKYNEPEYTFIRYVFTTDW